MGIYGVVNLGLVEIGENSLFFWKARFVITEFLLSPLDYNTGWLKFPPLSLKLPCVTVVMRILKLLVFTPFLSEAFESLKKWLLGLDSITIS